MLYEPHPHERRHRDFQPGRPLSIAQIIASGSADVETVALVWMLLEHGASLTVAGPTEPRPGAGKSTTVHALLPFLPQESALAFLSGRYETFAFTRLPDVDPATTYAVCTEISDHQSTYMWGAKARRFLLLPAQGYHIVTSVHADTLDDVLHLYQHDLLLRVEDLCRLGLVVNIGLSGRGKERRRRWLSTCFLGQRTGARHAERPVPFLLSSWDAPSDSFWHADRSVTAALACWTGRSHEDFTAALARRAACLAALAATGGAAALQVDEAIRQVRSLEAVCATL